MWQDARFHGIILVRCSCGVKRTEDAVNGLNVDHVLDSLLHVRKRHLQLGIIFLYPESRSGFCAAFGSTGAH